jgi:predicted ferric reductase
VFGRMPIIQHIRTWPWTVRVVYGLTAVIVVNSVINIVDAVMYRIDKGAWFFAADTNDPLYELGTSLGFWGMLFFCINFILATRWQWVEALSGGLDKVYHLHAFVGKSAMSLLLLHLFILIAQAIPDLRTLVAYMVPGIDLSYTLGMFGLMVLTGLVIVTLWLKMPYQSWLDSHKYMGIAYVLGGAHALVAQLDWYIALMTAVGGYAWVYSLFLYRKRAPHAHGQVAQIRHEQRITELVLRLEKPFPAKAGQFVFFGVTKSVAGLPTELHPFSVSQIIDDSTIRISAKAIGDYTGLLPKLQVDDKVVVYGPHGMFGQQGATGGAQIWVAGGIGITPFLSLLQAEVRQPRAASVHVIWAVRQREEAIYAQEMHDLVANAPHVTIHIHQGVLTAEEIEQMTGQNMMSATTIFVCGPVPMMRGLRSQWRMRGVAQHQIVSEEFGMR